MVCPMFFFCASHVELQSLVEREFSRSLNSNAADIMNNRVQQSSLRFVSGDESIDLRVCQGMPPGQEKSAELFGNCFRDVVNHWIEGTSEYCIYGEALFAGGSRTGHINIR